MRRILIDLQSLQADAAARGIGRYIRDFVSEFVISQESWDVEFLLNGSNQLEFSSVYAFLLNLTPRPKIHVWYPPENAGPNFQELASISLEALYLKVDPDLVLIGSLFEERRKVIHTHISNQVATAVIVYDFIPLLFQDRYLSDPEKRAWYLERVEQLKNAKFLLCISEHTLKDAFEILKVSRENLFYIGSATSIFADQIQAEPAARNEDTLLYVGGIDWRKNVEGLIEAFSISEARSNGLKLKIVCEIDSASSTRLTKLARDLRIALEEIEFTGFISDEDLADSYRKASFCIFPSIYEGFGLPVLEAMRFGKAVLVADSSSLGEIQPNILARFDPHSALAMARAIDGAYFDQEFRELLESETSANLETHTWKNVVARFEISVSGAVGRTKSFDESKKLKLAYFSPLPPTKSGIANYSSQLLPELSRFYDITVIDSETASGESNALGLPVESGSWFTQNASRFQRVIYQLGNSPWHEEAFRFIETHPGISVIHDFFLGRFHSWVETSGVRPDIWHQAVLHSHGLKGLAKLQDPKANVGDKANLELEYPANLLVQQNSIATIFHSDRASSLNRQWVKFFKEPPLELSVPLIPTVKSPDPKNHSQGSLSRFEIGEKDVVVASFGFTSENKGHLEIVEAFAQISLDSVSRIILVFVGGDSSADYAREIGERISELNLDGRVILTGWVQEDEYLAWLSRADVVIQLRKSLFGESSGTFLDALSFGKFVITNRGLSDEPSGDFLSVLKLDFTVDDLADALQDILKRDPDKLKVRDAALDYVARNHNSAHLAQLYFEGIEAAYQSGTARMFDFLSRIDSKNLAEKDLELLSSSLADSLEPRPRVRQIFIDVSSINFKDEGTGIHRVVNMIGADFLLRESPGEVVIPVFFDARAGEYAPANKFAQTKLDLGNSNVSYGDHIQAWEGDYFLGLDLSLRDFQSKTQELKRLQARGVRVGTVLYDILPVEHPEFFTDDLAGEFEKWLSFTAQFDDVFCISKTSARKYENWKSEQAIGSKVKIDTFRLGSDLNPRNELAASSAKLSNSFLMVGTLEPRKGYLETIRVFTELWEKGEQATLTIVGKKGWLNRDLIRTIKSHKQYGKKLIWHSKATDEKLASLYRTSTALIAASYGEGFGLPLIEAGSYRLPVVARDIEIFREVASASTIFYNEQTGTNLISTLKGIIGGAISLDFSAEAFPVPTTWSEAADSLWHLLHKGTDQ